MIGKVEKERKPTSLFKRHKRRSALHTRPSNEKRITGNSADISAMKLGKSKDKSDYKDKLRPTKTTNYKEQLDAFSPNQSDSESVTEEVNNNVCGSTVLPNNEKKLKEIIEKSKTETRLLQTFVHEEEEKDQRKFICTYRRSTHL